MSMQCLEDGLYNLIGPGEDVTVPESQNPKSCGAQKVIPSGVIRDLLQMLAPVQLDDDQRFDASEVANIQAHLMLATELESTELSAAYASP